MASVKTIRLTKKGTNVTRGWRVEWWYKDDAGERQHRSDTFPVAFGKHLVDQFAANKLLQLSMPEYHTPPTPTVKTLVARWKRDKLPTVEGGTHATWEGTARRHIPDWLLDMNAGNVTGADIARALREKALTHGTATVEKLRTTLSSIFAEAVTQETLTSNPVKSAGRTPKGLTKHAGKAARAAREGKPAPAKPVNHVGETDTAVNPDEVPTVEQVEQLNGLLPSHWLLFATTLASAGLRISEAAALTFKAVRPPDANIPTHHIRVVQALDGSPKKYRKAGPVKGPKSRTSTRSVPIPQWLYDELMASKPEDDDQDTDTVGEQRLFTTPGGSPVRPDNFRKRIWHPARIKAGLPEHITPHSYRHHAASRWIAAGVNIAAIARALGHASPVITLAIYSHLFTDDYEALAAVMDRSTLKLDCHR